MLGRYENKLRKHLHIEVGLALTKKVLSACVFARQFWHDLLACFGMQAAVPQAHNVSFYSWWQQASDRLHTTVQ
jgi:hypothetical protein